MGKGNSLYMIKLKIKSKQIKKILITIVCAITCFVAFYICKYILFINKNNGKALNNYKTFYNLEIILKQYCLNIESNNINTLKSITSLSGKKSASEYSEIAKKYNLETFNMIDAIEIYNNIYKCKYNIYDVDDNLKVASITIKLYEDDNRFIILYSHFE